MPNRLTHLQLSKKVRRSSSAAVTLLAAIVVMTACVNVARIPRPRHDTARNEAHIHRPDCCDNEAQTRTSLFTILLLSLGAFGAGLAFAYVQDGRKNRERLSTRAPSGEWVAIRPAPAINAGLLCPSILHDLRNPLAAIHGAAQLLVDADLPPSQIRRLGSNIHSASQRIQALLEDLLNASHGEHRAPEPVGLRELVMTAWESVYASANSHGAVLAVDIQHEIELPVQRRRMERAFVNLIVNAIEAMPEGGEVRIWAQIVKGSVLVHVDDSGPGVPPDIRHKLFQPFVTVGKRGGLGLGLAFTRQTVLDHKGEIAVGTAPGGGARFSLRLPGAHVVDPRALAG